MGTCSHTWEQASNEKEVTEDKALLYLQVSKMAKAKKLETKL